MGGSIGSRFEASPNALNFLRLCLAFEVVLWHAYSLRGDDWLPDHVERFVGDVGVDSFFAISGFLICRAWSRRRSTGAYLLARARRILPGMWICLLATAFVIAPVASILAGGQLPTLSGGIHYVLGNADTWRHQWDIDGTPSGVTVAGWNGSLWTLGYESACYLVVAALGLVRLLRPMVVAGLAMAFWAVSAALTLTGIDIPGNPLCATPRFGLMFSLGALLWIHRDRIPLSRFLAGAAVACLLVGALTPNYRLIAAPGLAYLCVYLGIHWGRYPRLVLRNDLSYGVYIYGFPVQQALLVVGITGGVWAGFVGLSVMCATSLATLSWFLIERPAAGRGRRMAVGAAPATKRIITSGCVSDGSIA